MLPVSLDIGSGFIFTMNGNLFWVDRYSLGAFFFFFGQAPLVLNRTIIA